VIMEVKHSIEAQNIANSGWDFKNANTPLSLSFYARSSVAGTYYSYVRNTDASPEQYYRFSFVLSANTWTKVEKTIEGNSNLVFPTDNGEGLAIFWVPAFGTNYSGSSVNLNQWETLTGSDYIPDITHAWGNTNGATFDLTGVQLEVGQNATEFEHEPFERTLAKCQRYFQYLPSGAVGRWNSSTECELGFNCPVVMRATPSNSINPNDNTAAIFRMGISVNACTISSLNAVYMSPSGGAAVVTVSSVASTPSSGDMALYDTDGDSEVIFLDSEL